MRSFSLRVKILLAIITFLGIALLSVLESRRHTTQRQETIPSYTKYQSYDFYQESSDSTFVTAQGTWNSQTKDSDFKRTQTITCIHTDHSEPYVHESDFLSKGLCVVSTAIFDTLNQDISSKTDFYDITTWTNKEVIAIGEESKYACFREVLTLDREKQTVSLLSTKLLDADPAAQCGFFWNNKPDSELYTLGCGPTPWPVKIVEIGTANPIKDYCSPDFEHMTKEQRLLFLKSGS